jgi:hypothetical protein
MTAGLILGLAVILLVFAVQPCPALQANQPCCGHDTGCHHPDRARICTMQSNAFITPEHGAPITHLPASSLVEFAPPVGFSPIHRAAVLTCPAGSDDLYLRNSVLLI